MSARSDSAQSDSRFAVRPADDEALEVVDTSNGSNVVVCTCWQEPHFAYDIARLLNSEKGA